LTAWNSNALTLMQTSISHRLTMEIALTFSNKEESK